MRISVWHFVLFAIILAQGCGYHLRGHSPKVDRSPVAYSVHVNAGAGPLADSLKAQLVTAGVVISDDLQGADYSLTVYDEELQRQIASVSPATGKVEEYLLVFTCRISIGKTGGEDLVTGQLIRASGDYAFDEDAALGKFAEEETIVGELQEQAAAQIVRRLGALAK